MDCYKRWVLSLKIHKTFVLPALIFASIFLSVPVFSEETAAANAAPALQKVIFTPQWFPQAQFAGYYMAQELGLSVVAEGISDESDALQLRQMGCEYVQSFMFGAPMPAEGALKLLKEQYPLAQA